MAEEVDDHTKRKDHSLSYRYWVGKRGGETEAPVPVAIPKPLSQEELHALQRVESKGSAWNQVREGEPPLLGQGGMDSGSGSGGGEDLRR